MTQNTRCFAAFTNKTTELELKNRQVSYEAACEGIVLLENNNILPIKPGKIALYGAGARHTIKGGTGSGEVNSRDSISIYEGLKNKGFEISTEKWLDEYDREHEECFSRYAEEASKKINLLNIYDIESIMANPYRFPDGPEIYKEAYDDFKADTCIYVLSRQAGESGDRKLDRKDYSLTNNERHYIKTCAKDYKNMILVINVGCSFDMSEISKIKGIGAIIFMPGEGCDGGRAFADLITGDVPFSGKLSTTWVNNYKDVPFGEEYGYLGGDAKVGKYHESIYVGYRYYDSFGVDVKYPFGHGLTYAEFSMIVGERKLNKSKFTLPVTMTNSSITQDGKEVLQMYISCPQGVLPKEYKKLVAFKKTKLLKPGESQNFEMSFDFKDVASYDAARASYILEQGSYIISVGTSSQDIVEVAVVHLGKEIVVSTHANVAPMQEKIPEIYNLEIEMKVPDDTPRLEFDTSCIKTKKYNYDEPEVATNSEVDKLMQGLKTEDMVKLVTGNGFTTKGYINIPGAAGHTMSGLEKKGIPNVALADGPAGLRLRRVSSINSKGQVKPIDDDLFAMQFIPDFIKKRIKGDEASDTLLYQYTTAFPVGISLASTWNVELVEKVGQAVSEEMTRFGVSFWLAPGMNIIRNPLCGRNFEYYSEDPVVAGNMAAAITRGVEAVEGHYVTIKHFACNNQEDERFVTDAIVSERALREIYLKGFEIAVKTASPSALMTSYNKVNGTYTPNSYDLITKVLRCEWGFDGVVMSDWMSTMKGRGRNDLAIAAGNDLIMPGGKYHIAEVKKGLKEGTVTEAALERSARRILKSIVKTDIYRRFKEEK